MIRVLIGYATKTGTAETCCEILEKELKGLDVTLCSLEQQMPDLSGFDAAVIGSSVRFGKLRPSARKFLDAHGEQLKAMPHGLFLCCGNGHVFDEYAEKLFDRELRESAFGVLNFGGSLKLEKAGRWERYLLYLARTHIKESDLENGEYTPTFPSILPENVSRMASALREEIRRERL